ncbi:type IV secretion system protein VirB9, putative [Campylobacter upsaliensis]|uniref:P-type conjugative transfer protein VirB9 n=2 Tax=Campylobacter TaxID=194 RepID=UPI000E12C052|nr:P-type conjugative transfer protein VirB9 [Campylobacter upsaliensis]EEY3085997.1 P-type conjugative transfer protein VirB9 [Campylobacter jejuni]EAH5199930.1 P-type conjugative transfer protein VirB9 [Campylobacter upsaliensis]EAI4345263.1 P-type conjugative transfer protein VirB9 [Campylobacter upsaliensis]EAI8173316.1 P-type conjugative transfer protein VirB9 [Campylobacter upsaliensis]EAJ7108472.1 P-type conjugative transfer protein VirB9 [Campylobacter upsaliensis]
MKKLILVSFLMCSFLNALELPQTSKYDKKITYAVFNAHQVFRIASANGYVSVVEFSKDERIINTATGFSQGWELTDKGNLLFIKPKAYTTKYIHSENPEEGNAISEIIVDPNPAEWKTNLIVTTNLNMYVFDLVLNSKEKVYKLSFSYPQKELENVQKLQAELKKQIEEDKIDTSLNRVSVPRNWDFYMKVNKESESIAPNFAYDDGVFTYLGFDNTKTFPAVFAYELGKESILNTHIKKIGNYDVLVIHKTLPKILLRSGEKVVGIFNRGYAKNPLNSTPQTANDKEVERVLLDEKSKKKEQSIKSLKELGLKDE